MVHPHHLIKRCKVCSDQAPGFNFQGLSCDSCKAFFRRNAHRECTFRCINGTTGQCQVNLINRKKCKACRLFKCLHVAGMQKERIRRGEERSYQQQQQQQQQQTQLSPFDPNFRCLDSNSLQLYEQRQLALVEYAFGAYLDETNLPIVGRLETPSEILNLPGEYIVSTIRFCKRLPAFRSLPAADQLILFKGFFPEKNSVRVSYKYDQEIDGWTGVRDYQEPQQRHGVLVTLKNMRPWACEELVSVFFSFIRQLHEEMEDDVNIRNLVGEFGEF
ncbi:PREDICTED: nuclear receptor subfamily 1 group I member 3-like [Rhagoletis zephyria]|uniref:nuclear receptor subfamily 1 group I member 3-like n=1 Tax=Rhagoletis zephyria TaxID=28612 RepID=UPI0008115CA8|nr:PREDICTED: nuclear receptor subfamily 1 group I member 3-like [Rhagoletis zephyria]